MEENIQEKIVLRLSTVEYRKLEKLVSRTHVRENTSPIEVAHQLGVQHVLALLRDGYVVG